MFAVKHQEMYTRMLIIATGFHHVVNYHGGDDIPMFQHHPTSFSSSTSMG
jgi:hypothetical protein